MHDCMATSSDEKKLILRRLGRLCGKAGWLRTSPPSVRSLNSVELLRPPLEMVVHRTGGVALRATFFDLDSWGWKGIKKTPFFPFSHPTCMVYSKAFHTEDIHHKPLAYFSPHLFFFFFWSCYCCVPRFIFFRFRFFLFIYTFTLNCQSWLAHYKGSLSIICVSLSPIPYGSYFKNCKTIATHVGTGKFYENSIEASPFPGQREFYLEGCRSYNLWSAVDQWEEVRSGCSGSWNLGSHRICCPGRDCGKRENKQSVYEAGFEPVKSSSGGVGNENVRHLTVLCNLT